VRPSKLVAWASCIPARALTRRHPAIPHALDRAVLSQRDSIAVLAAGALPVDTQKVSELSYPNVVSATQNIAGVKFQSDHAVAQNCAKRPVLPKSAWSNFALSSVTPIAARFCCAEG
jgi:hypothetical protein